MSADRHEPEDAVILEPGGSLDERTEIEPIRAGRVRCLDRELEPRDLARADVLSRLLGDAVVAGPSGVGRAEEPVAAERARPILTGLGAPGPEVGDLPHAAADPAQRPRVVERDRGGGALPTAKRR